MSQRDPTVVHVTGTDVVLTNARRSSARVGKVLGREHQQGQEVVYVDRLIHSVDEELADGWVAGGVVSTILSRAIL